MPTPMPAAFDPSRGNFEAISDAPPPVPLSDAKRDQNRRARLVSGAVGAFIIFLMVGGVVAIVEILVHNSNPGGAGPVTFSILLAMFLLSFLAIGLTTRLRKPLDVPVAAVDSAALSRFATDNGLVFGKKDQPPNYPGCVFTTGVAFPLLYDHFSTPAGRVVSFGNFCARSIDLILQIEGPDQPVPEADIQASWGFLAVQLDQHLPNMMLTSKHRVPGPALPFVPDPNQVLSLEGDFDNFFTLYCAAQFELEALAVFTPDLMALLIDEAAPFDVELVDDWMFFYTPHPFDPMDASVYRRLFTILTTIGSKTVAQTRLYSNPALGPVAAAIPAPTGWHWVSNPALFPDTSAPAGNRLRPKSQRPGLYIGLGIWCVWIALIALAAFWMSHT